MSDKEHNSPTPDHQEQSKSARPQRSIRGVRWLLVCLAIFSCNLLYGLDNTIVADIQAAIIDSFGGVSKLGWLGIGFPLGSIAIILPIGKAYAIFDVKWLYVGSLAMFAAGSALCGAAPTMDALIVGRVWAGAGGAGMYLGNLNLIQRLTTPQERSLYMATVVLVYGAGAILGPVVGGSLADSSSTGWRWAFYLNLFIFAAMAPVYIFLLPSIQPQPGVGSLTKLLSLDWVGAVLSSTMYTTFAMIFTFGGSIWPWGGGRMIALYVVCAATTIAFAVTQYFALFTTKQNRLFPGHFLRDRTLVLLFICCCCLGGALFVTIYYLPLYFQFVRNDNGVEAAVRLLPFICFYVFGVVLNGLLMLRWGYYMPWFLVSGVFATIGGALLYTSSADMANANVYGYSILVGIGMTAYQAAYSVVPAKVSPDEVAEVIQFINIAQQGSILIALTICNTVFQNVAYDKLLAILIPAGYSEVDVTAAIAGARSVVLQSAPPDVRSAALDVLVEAIDDAYTLIIVSGGLLIICALLMKREKITMELVAGG
ncbi:Major facilitator superfamily [Macrophomina phaseolina MS6]|uniref:Major facilitator superfamily n=1 Tax=Macrophomina phaseolina (strain MS6) TaxID=1126212 RepID=K2RW37_MACPH|nr:Major facilitator superfamily [Macrophomina phaseolina MS6]